MPPVLIGGWQMLALKRFPALLLALAAGCSNTGAGAPAAATPAVAASSAPAGNTRIVPLPDGTQGELVGYPAPRSKFARIRLGMRQREVEDLIGRPTNEDSHITGKSFIPFYFGGDTHRIEAIYRGEGTLTYSPQHFAGEANTLIRIIYDPHEQGYAH